MACILVAGPFKTRAEAEETASYLGNAQHSVYGNAHVDAEGYTLDTCDWFVERDDTIVPDRIFGYDTQAFLAKQYR
jgi:hypothetical protein